MGMYDTFVNEDRSLAVQLKTGPCEGYTYEVGDSVLKEFPDAAIYHAPDGVVVIRDGKVESVTKTVPEGTDGLPSFTKWGDPFYPKSTLEDPGPTLDDYNPIVQAIKEVERQHGGS